MRVGIHTGKIVAGIIGSKVVRYDIFGEGVLIAKKMEQWGVPGKICISEDTKKVLATQTDIISEYQIDHHKQVYLAAIEKTIKSFTIDRKIPESVDSAMLDSNSYNSMSGASEKNDNINDLSKNKVETSGDNGSVQNINMQFNKRSPNLQAQDVGRGEKTEKQDLRKLKVKPSKTAAASQVQGELKKADKQVVQQPSPATGTNENERSMKESERSEQHKVNKNTSKYLDDTGSSKNNIASGEDL